MHDSFGLTLYFWSYAQAIASRMIFVLRYPLLDNLPAMPDIMEYRPGREMRDPTSPIAFFAVNPTNRSHLVPIAIQMDVKPGMRTGYIYKESFQMTSQWNGSHLVGGELFLCKFAWPLVTWVKTSIASWIIWQGYDQAQWKTSGKLLEFFFYLLSSSLPYHLATQTIDKHQL